MREEDPGKLKRKKRKDLTTTKVIRVMTMMIEITIKIENDLNHVTLVTQQTNLPEAQHLIITRKTDKEV